MTQEELEALLGRPLTPTEVENLDLYLSIAEQRLDDLLCMTLTSDEATRVYDGRSGYRTLYVDPFTAIDTVEIDGETIDASKYSVLQFDKHNASWYNVIRFKKNMNCDEVTVTATWGFGSDMPVDLQLLLARLFDLVGKEQTTNGKVKSKRVEDFSITFNDNSDAQQFFSENQATIDKYSLCNVGLVTHGDINECLC